MFLNWRCLGSLTTTLSMINRSSIKNGKRTFLYPWPIQKFYCFQLFKHRNNIETESQIHHSRYGIALIPIVFIFFQHRIFFLNIFLSQRLFFCTASYGSTKWRKFHLSAYRTQFSSLPGPAALGAEVSQVFNQLFFSFSKLLVVVLGPVSVEELVSVEDAPSARFALYRI